VTGEHLRDRRSNGGDHGAEHNDIRHTDQPKKVARSAVTILAATLARATPRRSRVLQRLVLVGNYRPCPVSDS
jgi:hypothetical protein